MTRITLPWPPAALSPNASGQGKWRKKSEAAKAYKNTCIKECWAQRIRKIDADEVAVTIVFNPPRSGKYDLDNALARAKQGLDAVAEAIGVDDACWQSMSLVRGQKVKGGNISVQIRALGKGVKNIPLRGAVT